MQTNTARSAVIRSEAVRLFFLFLHLPLAPIAVRTRRANERIHECTVARIVQDTLRMPLDTDEKAITRQLDSLNRTVCGIRRNDRTRRRRPHTLVMITVCFQYIRTKERVQTCPPYDTHTVRTVAVPFNMLHQRSSGKHVERLNPSADAEDGNSAVKNSVKQRRLKGIALRGNFPARSLLQSTVQPRMKIHTAGKQHAVQSGTGSTQRILPRTQIEKHRDSTCGKHSLRIRRSDPDALCQRIVLRRNANQRSADRKSTGLNQNRLFFPSERIRRPHG